MDRIGNSYLSSFATAENTKEITMLPVGTVINANGAMANGVDASSYREGLLFINVTAVSGTSPTLNLTLQTYDAVSGAWYPVPNVNISQITAVGTPNPIPVTNFGETLRLSYTVGGTSPSFTLSVDFVAKS